MIMEAAYAMLATVRVGAAHSVVFGGFSPNALADRINSFNPKLIITADEGRRGGKTIPLKKNVNEALKILNKDIKTLVVENTGAEVPLYDRDISYSKEKENVSDIHNKISTQNA